MESCFDLYFNDEEESFLDVARVRKSIRDYSNPLELPDAKFVRYFRLNKDGFIYLFNEIKDFLKQPVRTSAIPPILKLCTALRFFAEGNYQKGCNKDFNLGLAQATVSLVLKEVLNVIDKRICGQWINATLSEKDQNRSKLSFFSDTGFPGVIGCVDGTYVRITAPKKSLQSIYQNRKGYYSLNVMIVCDYKMNIRYVDAGHPGSKDDSFVWDSSEYKKHLQRNIQENTWILGDKGYPLEPFLMTPFHVAQTDSPEACYNKKHAKARNVIVRTIGIIKNKFKCLVSARGLHYKPEKAAQIVNACCALHNISQHYRVEYPDKLEFATNNEENHALDMGIIETGPANAIRNNIMQSLCRFSDNK